MENEFQNTYAEIERMKNDGFQERKWVLLLGCIITGTILVSFFIIPYLKKNIIEEHNMKVSKDKKG
jgi:hypothetical protein